MGKCDTTHQSPATKGSATKWLATKKVGGCGWWLVARGWWLVVGGWWLVAGGWLLVACG